MGEEQGIPAVENGVRDIKPGTKLLDRISSGKIFGNDTEDKKQAISTVGDDQIRKNGMGMPAASADNPADTDGMINWFSGDKVNEIPVIRGMGVAGVGGTTTRAGFFLREKTSHKRVKKQFRRRFHTVFLWKKYKTDSIILSKFKVLEWRK